MDLSTRETGRTGTLTVGGPYHLKMEVGMRATGVTASTTARASMYKGMFKNGKMIS